MSGSETKAAENLNDEINLFDIVIVLFKRKRLIAGIALSSAIIAAIISLMTPPVYRAETKILPPQQGGSGMAGQLQSQLGGGFISSYGSAFGIKGTNDLYIGLLKSRRILDPMIDRFNLIDIYANREGARNALAGAIKTQEDKRSGILTIGVEDKDPVMAADMANAFVDELKNLTKGLAVTEASQRRLFFEEQLKDAKTALTKAEDDMKGFQETTGALQIDAQANAVITGIADLRARIAAKEVEMKVMATFATSQNPDLQRLKEELNGMKAELRKLETKGGNGYDPLMSTGRIPSVGTEYIRKLRDLKFNETLYELLLKQYEIAKIDESRDATIIQVIDNAIPPEKRIKPVRRRMVMVGLTAGLFFSIFSAFLLEFMENSRNNIQHRGKIETLRKHMRL